MKSTEKESKVQTKIIVADFSKGLELYDSIKTQLKDLEVGTLGKKLWEFNSETLMHLSVFPSVYLHYLPAMEVKGYRIVLLGWEWISAFMHDSSSIKSILGITCFLVRGCPALLCPRYLFVVDVHGCFPFCIFTVNNVGMSYSFPNYLLELPDREEVNTWKTLMINI